MKALINLWQQSLVAETMCQIHFYSVPAKRKPVRERNQAKKADLTAFGIFFFYFNQSVLFLAVAKLETIYIPLKRTETVSVKKSFGLSSPWKGSFYLHFSTE